MVMRNSAAQTARMRTVVWQAAMLLLAALLQSLHVLVWWQQ
jgi:hypothetical protein